MDLAIYNIYYYLLLNENTWQFQVGNEICGAVVSVRYQEDQLSLWNRSSSDQASTARIRDTLRRILNLTPGTNIDYKVHVDSLKYVSPQ